LSLFSEVEASPLNESMSSNSDVSPNSKAGQSFQIDGGLHFNRCWDSIKRITYIKGCVGFNKKN
jgi:hypothetical protein